MLRNPALEGCVLLLLQGCAALQGLHGRSVW
jgi:hypothetical protein